ncbi:Arc family DNA-binding protein [Acinetobacter populi]|uniref:Arc-like DNA binding domain-containing protein n=1 Tax=Acinetobacter populi TaxID=1582270 RepID=A0A1Z9YXP8_9GAMM|nr:Arc family DNA-binding protein [Acinetobacter populi]OUY06987.1 hypothetical protein CAP51_09835 [Acinetobacter populi]
MARNDPQFNLRVPVELKQKVEEAAKESGRSINAEAVYRLEESFIETIPAEGLNQIVAAYLMGMHSRYLSERDDLVAMLQQKSNNSELKIKIEKYDLLISEIRSNAERLFPNAFKKSDES